MSALYPLQFKTIFKDKIWGGQKIKTYLHKDFGNLPNCGETWEFQALKLMFR
jgi:mannose-6-phosphate isomerase